MRGVYIEGASRNGRERANICNVYKQGRHIKSVIIGK